MKIQFLQVKKTKIDSLDELHLIFKKWAELNNYLFPDFTNSGGKLIFHFDKDNKLRQFEIQKTEFKR